MPQDNQSHCQPHMKTGIFLRNPVTRMSSTYTGKDCLSEERHSRGALWDSRRTLSSFGDPTKLNCPAYFWDHKLPGLHPSSMLVRALDSLLQKNKKSRANFRILNVP
jgi:hypothetical protein